MTCGVGESALITAEAVGEGEAHALLRAYFAELSTELGQPEVPADTGADLAPPRGSFLVARVDGAAVGCVGLRLLSCDMVEVKRLYVAPSGRRLGLGTRLLSAAQTAAQGLTSAPPARLVLDTDPRLAPARRLYERFGFAKVPPYNDNPRAGLWFAMPLR